MNFEQPKTATWPYAPEIARRLKNKIACRLLSDRISHRMPYFCGALKIPITIVLIALIALQTFSQWCLILEYQVNRDYIAKNLCVNRNNVSCCCKGKCFLNKKMATNQSQQQAPGKGGQKDESPLQPEVSINTLPALQAPALIVRNPARYLASLSQEFTHSVFEPPRA